MMTIMKERPVIEEDIFVGEEPNVRAERELE